MIQSEDEKRKKINFHGTIYIVGAKRHIIYNQVKTYSRRKYYKGFHVIYSSTF